MPWLRNGARPITEDTMARFDGKLALVTGANSGVGLATTLQLVRQGAHIVNYGTQREQRFRLQCAGQRIADHRIAREYQNL